MLGWGLCDGGLWLLGQASQHTVASKLGKRLPFASMWSYGSLRSWRDVAACSLKVRGLTAQVEVDATAILCLCREPEQTTDDMAAAMEKIADDLVQQFEQEWKPAAENMEKATKAFDDLEGLMSSQLHASGALAIGVGLRQAHVPPQWLLPMAVSHSKLCAPPVFTLSKACACKLPVKVIAEKLHWGPWLPAGLMDGPDGFDSSLSVWQSTGWAEVESLRKKLEDLPELRELVRQLGRAGGVGPLRRAPEEVNLVVSRCQADGAAGVGRSGPSPGRLAASGLALQPPATGVAADIQLSRDGRSGLLLMLLISLFPEELVWHLMSNASCQGLARHGCCSRCQCPLPAAFGSDQHSQPPGTATLSLSGLLPQLPQPPVCRCASQGALRASFGPHCNLRRHGALPGRGICLACCPLRPT